MDPCRFQILDLLRASVLWYVVFCRSRDVMESSHQTHEPGGNDPVRYIDIALSHAQHDAFLSFADV